MNACVLATGDPQELLKGFRAGAYRCFTRAGDALFELGDALLLSPGATSTVELSLSAVFRRQWGSVYAALSDGQVDHDGLLGLLLGHAPEGERPLWAYDHSAWPRPDAPTVRERAYHHHPTDVPGGTPVCVGHAYSTLGIVPEGAGSWFLPLLHERIPTEQTPLEVAAEQLRRACAAVSYRPLGTGDSEYGCATFLGLTADLPCDQLLRLRPNRVLYQAPPPYSGKGRPRTHGAKFALRKPETWGEPAEEVLVDDPKWGSVKVQCWHRLHFGKLAAQPFTVIRVEVLRARGTRRDPKVMWLLWKGEDLLPLAEAWRKYLRRFVIEHWYRFSKQPLHWTMPRVKTPEQGQVWSDLIVVVSWELWLGRAVIEDQPRPWEKLVRQPEELTPGRVLRAIGGVLAAIGTPAVPPKPRGKSPGRRKGQSPGRSERFPVVKKSKKRKKRARKAR